MKGYGATQAAFLRAMRRNGGKWSPSSGWIWGGLKTSQKIAESLLKHGEVEKFEHTYIHHLTKQSVTETVYRVKS